MSEDAGDAERAAEIAERLLDAMVDGDIDAEIAQVSEPDSRPVLGALVRRLALTHATLRLADEEGADVAVGEPIEDVENP